MKIFSIAATLLLMAGCSTVSAQRQGRHPDTLFQISTLNALLAGDYDGHANYRSVKKHGNFGLGTFTALDGEMVAVDGKFYQVHEDGTVSVVENKQQTPFAAVTFFKADDAFTISGETSCTELHELLQQRFPSNSFPYAIKVSGFFTSLTTRSVPRQEKPYPPLAEALQQQAVFNFDDVGATLAGFWLPADLSGINVTGFHFHAITANALAGGHVLDCEAYDVEVEIDYTTELQVRFTDSERPQNKPKLRHESEQHDKLPVSHW